MSENLYFSVKSGIKSIVGKDLIIDDNIAIFELVKNSYDAHAKKVVITFEKNKIIIADDGKGMSLDDVHNKWLALAYSAKKNGTEDLEEPEDVNIKRISYRDQIQNKKVYAGAKGIGRFSSDRLGSKLKLATKKYNFDKIEILDINWTDFEQDDLEDFIKIPVTHNSVSSFKIPFPNNKNHGTILEISNSSNWSRSRIVDLKHSLEKLINPFSETENFIIEIISERDAEEDLKIDNKTKEFKYIERDRVNGEIQNSILDIIKLKTTELSLEVDSDFIHTKIIDRGTIIYHIKEKNKYNLFIDNLKINLYFLNFSAKVNFKKRMGIQPVQYGSVFLFKNGFRVQPYGSKGDDSWGLDYRAQQGYNRFIGTRDLFGRVDIITNNVEQFKEVSSRDGGLVDTVGFNHMKEIFILKAHRRLERYVSGVLWGEAFLRKKYFKTQNEGQNLRDDLNEDKNSDNFNIAKSNLGSKIDFIQLLKSLSNEKEITILDYNQELVDLVNDNINSVEPKFLKDLEKIADNLNDESLKKAYKLTDEHFHKLEKEKEEAIKQAEEEKRKREEEEQKRKEAEENAKKSEKAKIEAESKEQEEREKKIQAELEREKEKTKRIEAELAKLKAETEKEEEKNKREKAETEKEKFSEELYEEKKKSAFRGALIGVDKEKIIGLQHQVAHSSGRVNRNIKLLLKHQGNDLDNKSKQYISVMSLETKKVNSIANFITKANFNLTTDEIKTDLVSFIVDYINEIYLAGDNTIDTNLKIEFKQNSTEFDKKIVPLEITTLIDNFINNSEKAKAKKIIFDFVEENKNLILKISDDGNGISEVNINKIFELGYTTTDGSGIGLFQNNGIIKNLKGNITVNSEPSKKTTFIITIPK